MNPERWQKIVEVYQVASERSVEARASYLAEACSSDEELRREVESLLNQNVSGNGLLERVAQNATSSDFQRGVPDFIGPFRIFALIGEGGMGAVFRAEQDQPRRTVALKLIKPGFATAETVRRFEQESQVLGRLQHPGIAQIYQAGVSEGRPYFAMEFIQGLPLMDYVRGHALTVRQRIELMIKICDAVHHAHARGIIHRDLKPGNILVDDTGQPKVLDFGVARITDVAAQMSRRTDMGELVGTLAYMSPEQLTDDSSNLDARSDVYALGVILYELLAERPPYITGSNVPAAIRIICEQEPISLSTSGRQFRGDLENIATKALEKQRDRRYASAADLAADLNRHLLDQPIQARPASAMYQTGKFARRHMALTSVVVTVFVLLSIGIVVVSREAARSRRAEQTAQAVRDFLENDLLSQAAAQSQATPNTRPDPDIRVRTVLDRAAARIDGKFDSQPEVEASLRQMLGNTYRDLGLYDEAQKHMQRALEIRRRVSGNEAPETLSIMPELGELYLGAGKYADAEAVLSPLVEVRRRKFGINDQETLRAMNDFAAVVNYKGDYAQASRLRADVLEGDRRLLGEEHPYTLIAMGNLGSTYSSLGDYAKAEALYSKTVELMERVMGPAHPNTISSMNGLAQVYRNEGEYAKAEPLFQKVVESRQQLLGEEHVDTWIAMNTLAALYLAQQRYTDAEALLTHGLAIARRVRPDHPARYDFAYNLAETYRGQGKPREARSLYVESLEGRRKVLGPRHRSTVSVLISLGEASLEQKQYGDAERLLREAISIQDQTNQTDWRHYQALALLGKTLADLGRLDEARPLLASAYDGLSQKSLTIPFERRPIIETVRDWKSRIP